MKLEIQNLNVNIGGKQILTDIDLQLEEGSWLMVAGPNGAGKSTLARTVMQMTRYTGSVLIDGEDASKIRSKQLARKIGILMQNNYPGYDFTAGEVVRLGMYSQQDGFLKGKKEGAEEKFEEAVAAAGVGEFLDRPVTTLSGGELQRVFMAQLLTQDPDILILDEPVNHLDLTYQKQFMEITGRWQQEKGRTVISVVHDLSLAKMFGTDAILMNNGSIVASGKNADVFSDENLNKVYGMNVREWMRAELEQWA